MRAAENYAEVEQPRSSTPGDDYLVALRLCRHERRDMTIHLPGLNLVCRGRITSISERYGLEIRLTPENSRCVATGIAKGKIAIDFPLSCCLTFTHGDRMSAFTARVIGSKRLWWSGDAALIVELPS